MEEAGRMYLTRLAPLALVLLVVAGCGGGKSAAPAARRKIPGRRLRDRRQRRGEAGRRLRGADGRLDPAKTLHSRPRTNCGSFTSRSTRSRPQDDRLARRARRGRLLRRHGLSPDRPRLRHPGRRSDAERRGRPRLPDGGRAAVGRALRQGRRRDGEDGGEPPGTSGSQFFVVTGEDVGLPPDYAIVGTVTAGLDVVESIGELGDPATERPLQPVVIEKVTVGES